MNAGTRLAPEYHYERTTSVSDADCRDFSSSALWVAMVASALRPADNMIQTSQCEKSPSETTNGPAKPRSEPSRHIPNTSATMAPGFRSSTLTKLAASCEISVMRPRVG